MMSPPQRSLQELLLLLGRLQDLLRTTNQSAFEVLATTTNKHPGQADSTTNSESILNEMLSHLLSNRSNNMREHIRNEHFVHMSCQLKCNNILTPAELQDGPFLNQV